MRTERITFLTTPDHKAALDAFAAASGRSVGHVAREATSRYITAGQDDEAELAALVEQVNEAIPKMLESLRQSSEMLQASHRKIDALLREEGVR